jgi:hypothetical protein
MCSLYLIVTQPIPTLKMEAAWSPESSYLLTWVHGVTRKKSTVCTNYLYDWKVFHDAADSVVQISVMNIRYGYSKRLYTDGVLFNIYITVYGSIIFLLTQTS